MSEVEVEIRANRKLGALAKPHLEKALRSRALRILTAADLESISGERSSSTAVSLADIRSVGADYSFLVGKGEAYTHAAGALLDFPTVSNDVNAIRTLEANAKKLPPKILRSFDLFGFLYLEQYLKIAEGEQILKTLKAQSEWIPTRLRHSSFQDGINEIGIRLATSLRSCFKT